MTSFPSRPALLSSGRASEVQCNPIPVRAQPAAALTTLPAEGESYDDEQAGLITLPLDAKNILQEPVLDATRDGDRDASQSESKDGAGPPHPDHRPSHRC